MKPNWEDFFPIVPFLWVKLRRKTSLLVTPKILGSFVNTLTADHSSYNREKFPLAIQFDEIYPTRTCPIVSFLFVTLRWRTCLLVTFEIVGLFVNTLTANEKYSCYKREKSSQAFQMKLSKTQKSVMKFLLHFWNIHQILNSLEKKTNYIRHYWLQNISLL